MNSREREEIEPAKLFQHARSIDGNAIMNSREREEIEPVFSPNRFCTPQKTEIFSRSPFGTFLAKSVLRSPPPSLLRSSSKTKVMSPVPMTGLVGLKSTPAPQQNFGWVDEKQDEENEPSLRPRSGRKRKLVPPGANGREPSKLKHPPLVTEFLESADGIPTETEPLVEPEKKSSPLPKKLTRGITPKRSVGVPVPNFKKPIESLSCNCKKSRCLKLYCECFRNGHYCSGNFCNCTGCFNNAASEPQRTNACRAIMDRNSNVKFKKETHKGCRCKKSGCLKKYCECFQAGIECTSACSCHNCKNQKVDTS
eukprot:TRINITY_DN581_c0_g1_i2.p1 TRINITY_DN581_c0_g1~~TRINITY_DN581_c0_g1_i2.p1  ORF type:complete len:310 (+),score=32.20 TRINITY_DN581_c0_g1_i2:171-1100(+)